MVELKSTKRIFAMKVIKKELMTDDEDIDWVQTEKHVFETASNHPFLVGLHSCFQTASRYGTLHTAHCTLHTAHCTLHTAHCTLHTAHCR